MEIRNVTGRQLLVLTLCLTCIFSAYFVVGDHLFTAICGAVGTIGMAFVKRLGDPPDPKQMLPYELPDRTKFTVYFGDRK